MDFMLCMVSKHFKANKVTDLGVGFC